MESSQKEIIGTIAEYLGLLPSDIDRGSLISEDLNLTPLELNDLISYLSKKFDVVLSSEDITEVKSLDDLIVLIEDNLI